MLTFEDHDCDSDGEASMVFVETELDEDIADEEIQRV